MSEVVIDALAGLPDNVSESAAREHVATLVRGDAISMEAAHSALTAKGFALLNGNSKEHALGHKESLTRDANFMARYSAGDPAAIAELYRADLAVLNGKGDLLDRSPSSSDSQYDQVRNVVYANTPGEGAIEAADRVADIASSLHLDGASAKSMIELQYQADRDTANMTAEQRETWGDWQLQSLKSALGPDADNKLKVASEVISKLRGVKTDVAGTVRESGAQIGLQLISVAQVQAYKNKW
jgi:hypothetical protein